MTTARPTNTYSPTFGVVAEFLPDTDDSKPWAAFPENHTIEDAIQIAWGATADEAIARWGALYYWKSRQHEHAGRSDMINKEKMS